MLNRFSSRPKNLNSLAKIFSFKAQCSIATSSNAAPKYSASRTSNLFSRINSFRQDYDVVRVLDQWVDEGQKVHRVELQQIIRDLRSHKRFHHALQISEWTCRNAIYKFSPGDFAVHLDLIGVVRGCEAAERYFNNLGDKNKNEKTYGALLNCFVREGLLTKAIVHRHNMKDKGYASSTLVYNNLMALYKKAGQLEKIPEVLSEMIRDGVCPNNFTYIICINSFGERFDLSGMEKLLDEIESRKDVSLDWATYSVVAFHFIKGNKKEKALTYMKKLEEKLDNDGMGYNHLISLYAHLEDKDEIMRLWVLQKNVCKKQINRDYITILGSLVKLGEFDESEALLKEWDLSCHMYDFRVANILLIGYCQKGLVEKSEKLLRDIVNRGKKPTPNSWAIIASGYLDSGNMEKAFECMKEALAVKEQNMKWVPKSGQITKILQWLGDGEIEEVKAFVKSLRGVITVNSQMYFTLIKASTRVGEDIGWILYSMKADEIEVDDEIRKMISLRQGADDFELECSNIIEK